MQWLQDLNHSNVDNLNSVFYEASILCKGNGGISKS
jgi:hypothetical protein